MFFKSIIKILIFFSFHQLIFAKKEVTELRLMVGLASKASEELDISGTGTGFSVSRDGHIVTASHVTENSDQVRVTLKNGITYVARVIKEEHGLDLAILLAEPQV